MLVCTLTSAIASTEGRTPIVPMKRSLLSTPSMRLLFRTSFWPLTDTVDVCRRSSGRLPLDNELGNPSLAPGTMRTSPMTLRPFSGRSCTARSGSSAPTVALSDWTRGACAVTVMVSARVPTTSRASTRSRSPADTCTARVKLPNPAARSPGCSARSEAGRTCSRRCPPVTCVRVSPVAGFVTVTVAPGNAPPLASVTRPTTSAVVIWADAAPATANQPDHCENAQPHNAPRRGHHCPPITGHPRRQLSGRP